MYNPQEIVCFRCHKNPCECPAKGEPPFSASNGSAIGCRKTDEEIAQINEERARALRLVSEAIKIFEDTGCSRGAGILGEAANEIRTEGMDEY